MLGLVAYIVGRLRRDVHKQRVCTMEIFGFVKGY